MLYDAFGNDTFEITARRPGTIELIYRLWDGIMSATKCHHISQIGVGHGKNSVEMILCKINI